MELDGESSYVDRNGKMIIPPSYNYHSDFSEGLVSVSILLKVGYMDKTGRVLIEPDFTLASDFSNGLAEVYIAGQSAYINKQGKVIWKGPPPIDDRGINKDKK